MMHFLMEEGGERVIFLYTHVYVGVGNGALLAGAPYFFSLPGVFSRSIFTLGELHFLHQ